MEAKKIVIGILAHVDAGKTTLSEGILYFSGSIRKLGRVDHGNAFLDTEELERKRGITIFSKQAQFTLSDLEITLLDTPGHVDFSAETERTLQVLDYAVLVINGTDGVQSHTMTLWRLLKCYDIPVFLFINKMDQVGTDRRRLLEELQRRLDERCVDFGCFNCGQPDQFNQCGRLKRNDQSGQSLLDPVHEEIFGENIAVCDDALMEEYLQTGRLEQHSIARAIARRLVFPCYFGSALKGQGVEEFLQGIGRYGRRPEYAENFGAKVYKITRDHQGNRLTHMKITGGTLKVKTLLTNQEVTDGGKNEPFPGNQEKVLRGGQAAGIWQEKVDQIRIYAGNRFQAVEEVEAGTVCAVTGLKYTYSGEGLGMEASSDMPIIAPVLNYRILLPAGCDPYGMLLKLRQLEEEEPQLHLIYNEHAKEIHVQIMGEIELEILQSLIEERFDVSVEFGSGSIVYKETITEPMLGVGHFEPLRHYAEVHLLLEPGEPGSGLQFGSVCSEDVLDRNWQRLILSHLAARQHPGVLTGSEITDMKITLAAGRAHAKHTEGGDFRQATYRAVRQGLMKANCVLLEPVYEFRLEVPTEMVGRALTDLQKMHGSFKPPATQDNMSTVVGQAPVATMRDYQREVLAYTKGQGRLFCTLKGYEPCHNAEEIMAEKAYDAERDVENPTCSVFCSHGAGFVAPWNEVEDHMHVDSGLQPHQPQNEVERCLDKKKSNSNRQSGYADEKELAEIFTRTYGQTKRERYPVHNRKTIARKAEMTTVPRKTQEQKSKERYLLVDGYNIIFAWEELKALAEISPDSARERLIEILSNYQGYIQDTLIVVFDAYRVEGGKGSVIKYHNIYVVYTKEAETADQYIEKTVYKIGKTYDVTVATSDQLVQMIIWGRGAKRLSAQGLKEEIEAAEQKIRTIYESRNAKGKNYPLEKLADKLSKKKDT